MADNDTLRLLQVNFRIKAIKGEANIELPRNRTTFQSAHILVSHLYISEVSINGTLMIFHVSNKILRLEINRKF